MVVAEPEIAAHRFEVGFLHLLAHAFLVAEVAFDRGDRAVDQRHRVIGLRAVERRCGLVLRLEVGDELLVGVVGQVVDPFLGARHADGEILQPRQRQIVDGKGGVERDLALEAGLRILRDELHAGAARIEDEDRVGFCSAGFRQLGGEVELVGPARQFLADDLALEGGLHAVEHVLTGGIVRAHQERGLDALLVHVGADRGRRLVVVPRRREHVGRALFAGEL